MREGLFAALVGVGACTGPAERVDIAFEATLGDEEFQCGANASAGPEGAAVSVHDLRLFVHDIAVVKDGIAWPVTLEDSLWQDRRGVALLDFEDGCVNGTDATNTRVVGTTAADGPYDAVEFTLGVPFDLNHADPFRSSGALTTTAMHWGWNGGYKFLRLDYTMGEVSSRQHLGSTGCEGTIGAITGCAQPNRADIRVELAVPTEDPRISLDLDRITAEPDALYGCMGTEGIGCAPLFDAVGLDGSGQTLFVEAL